MSVTLSQSSTAAFPDRPASGGTGLLLTMATGVDGQYLAHDLGAEQALLHTRVMLCPGTAAGGAVALLRGLDGSETEVFRLTFDADAGAIDVSLASGQTLSATLAAGLLWHCIELKIDADGGKAELWLNGVSVDTAMGSLGALTTQTLWIGGVFKDKAATGDLYLDEWIVADDYLGPVIVAPQGNWAGDPARWLVLYNTADTDAAAWAEHYRQSRGVPFANLCGLALPTDETIDGDDFADLIDALNAYLDVNGLTGQVVGILAGYRVPGYVDFTGQGDLLPVASLLHADDPDAGAAPNPLAIDGQPTRPSAVNLNGLRLTARIDAVDLASAKALVDRAATLSSAGLGDGDNGTIWLDPYTTPGASVDPYIAAMVAWSQSIDRMRTRLPIQLSADSDPQQEVQFDQIDHDGFFWGWSQATPPAGFFASPTGARVFCFQLHLAAATCPTLRSAQPADWVDQALAAGYTAAAGASDDYSLTALPFVRPFFEALRQGWTLAEAWFVAAPVLRLSLFLVGDPLMTFALPRAGWDVFGPLDNLEHLDPTSPLAALRQSEQSLALATAQQPASGAAGAYVIRRVDELGRSEAGVRNVRAANVAALAAAPPLAPLWPDVDGWLARVEDGAIHLAALWERAIPAVGVDTVELLAEIDGGAEQSIATVTPQPMDRAVELVQSLPTQSARFCWRIAGAGGAVIDTPWSAMVYPLGAATIPVQIVEVSP